MTLSRREEDPKQSESRWKVEEDPNGTTHFLYSTGVNDMCFVGRRGGPTSSVRMCVAP